MTSNERRQLSLWPQLVADLFPTQPPELAREMITVSHYDLNIGRKLVFEVKLTKGEFVS
jgi:hypothetical protein